jgi:hypothetical protein
MKRLIGLVAVSMFALASAPAVAMPIHFGATLDGPSEAPPNASPGTGTALVIYDSVTHLLEVKVSFSGLLGITTASHIHCCTVVPMTGTVGVASETPTFSLFPLGVSSGSLDETYDLTLDASFNPSFETANGGTAASAEAALIAGLMSNSAYLNIHTNLFPGGEIRGFLAPIVVDNFPEPATLTLLGVGLAGVFAARRRMRKG